MKADAQPALEVPIQVAARERHRTRARTLLIKGMAVAIAALLLKVALEETPVGHWVDYQAYILFSKTNVFRSDPGVVLLDISKVAGGEKDQQSGRVVPTSRKVMLEIVRAAVAAGARAVFVDVDLSPDREGYLVPAEDLGFLEECLKLNSKIPVRLGVYRAMLSDEATWLGYHRYAPMAAALWLPEGEPRHLPTAFYPEEAAGRRLPALGAAFNSRASAMSDLRDLIGMRVRRHVDLSIAADIVVPADVTHVDYSIIPQLMRESRPVERAEDVKNIQDKLKDQLVFVGSLAPGRDAFPVPGTTEKRPGMAHHAALAYTLDRAPLWEAKVISRLVVDLGLSLLALLALLAAGVHRIRAEGHRRDVQGNVLLGASVGILLLGFSAIHIGRVFWTDAALAGLLLLWHPRVERLLEALKVFHLLPKRSRDEQVR